MWIVKLREAYKETFRHNKRGYTTFKFSNATDLRRFLASLVSYGGKPMDVKFYWDGK